MLPLWVWWVLVPAGSLLALGILVPRLVAFALSSLLGYAIGIENISVLGRNAQNITLRAKSGLELHVKEVIIGRNIYRDCQVYCTIHLVGVTVKLSTAITGARTSRSDKNSAHQIRLSPKLKLLLAVASVNITDWRVETALPEDSLIVSVSGQLTQIYLNGSADTVMITCHGLTQGLTWRENRIQELHISEESTIRITGGHQISCDVKKPNCDIIDTPAVKSLVRDLYARLSQNKAEEASRSKTTAATLDNHEENGVEYQLRLSEGSVKVFGSSLNITEAVIKRKLGFSGEARGLHFVPGVNYREESPFYLDLLTVCDSEGILHVTYRDLKASPGALLHNLLDLPKQLLPASVESLRFWQESGQVIVSRTDLSLKCSTSKVSQLKEECTISSVHLTRNLQGHAATNVAVEQLRVAFTESELADILKCAAEIKSLLAKTRVESDAKRPEALAVSFTRLGLALHSSSDQTISYRLQCDTPNFTLKLNDPYPMSLYVQGLTLKEQVQRVLLLRNENSLLMVKKANATHALVKGNIVCHWYPYVQKILFDSYLRVQASASLLRRLTSSYSRASHSQAAGANPVHLDLTHQVALTLHMESFLAGLHVQSSRYIYRGGRNLYAEVPQIEVSLLEQRAQSPSGPATVLRVSQLGLNFVANAPSVRAEMDDASDPTNDCLELNAATCELAFPYEMNFHRAFSTEFLGLVKWTKLLLAGLNENEDRRAPELPERIPPDLIICVRSFSFLLSDDPFEVRLRDNFELLEDEYLESDKRHACLNNKLEELRRTHIMLPSAKVDELYSNLVKKNTEIYIQRSRMLREKSTMRTRLFEICASAVKLCIISDSSMLGADAALNFIRENDVASWPQELAFSSLHFKWIRFESKNVIFKLRDFVQPFLDAKTVFAWGKVVLAEQQAQARAWRTQSVSMGHPDMPAVAIKRSLHSYKAYQDVAMDMDYFVFSHGPCWEPVISQVTLAMSFLTGLKPNDPSPPLPWWDKVRFRFHGRLLWSVKSYKMFLHTSLDPYNTTEEMELNLNEVNFQFRNNEEIRCCGKSLDLYARTASKYDDCRLFHIPNFGLSFGFNWQCQGHPYDHHHVLFCAPENLPDYSSNTMHDSYRLFRSSAVHIRARIETRSGSKSDHPRVHMFSSTIRWLESLKWLFSGTSRPIRRGNLFRNAKLKKQSFFRHIKEIGVSLALQKLELDYWTSASMTKGILVTIGGRLTFSGKYLMKQIKLDDKLLRRPRVQWLTEYTNCEISQKEVWFQSIALGEDGERVLEKHFFLSAETVKYNRDVPVSPRLENVSPSHCLTVVGARCAWTTSNRTMTFALYESWRRAHLLREQLSGEESVPLMGGAQASAPSKAQAAAPPLPADQRPRPVSSPPEPSDELSLSALKAWSGNEYVELRDSSGLTTTVYSEDQTLLTSEMEAKAACMKDDALHRAWQIKFINGQMLLKGCDTKGYVILSSSKAEATKNVHVPVWKDDALFSKSSWSGCFECMQYFATVSTEPDGDEAGGDAPLAAGIEEQGIQWLKLESIQPDEERNASDFLDDLGSVGGVLAHQSGPDQLQRIVSKCTCEFYHVNYGEEPLEEAVVDRMGKPLDKAALWSADDPSVVNAFALVHHDLNICTNSLQYSMVLDVLNNLLLFVDPTQRSRTENHLRMKYQLMLANVEDQKKPITQLRSQIRQLICQQRTKEKLLYNVQNSRDSDAQLTDELEGEIQDLKETVTWKSEELDLRLRCLRELNLSQFSSHSKHFNERKTELRHKTEIFFSRAQWRLTENDGQLGIADAAIVNFSYTRSIMKNDSTEHLMEMGYIHVKNLLKEQPYVDALRPTELKNAPVDRRRTLRVFCRQKAPVGGIVVNDHFEINLAPLTIGITHAFYKKLVLFCFPDKSSDAERDSTAGATATSSSKRDSSTRAAQGSSFYVASPLNKDDVEQMKERAQRNKLFVYIKIPEVPICVSFKGEREKNKILDVAAFLLQVPTIEYHNVTWTWLDFLTAVKNRTKDSLLSQAIKQKLRLRGPSSGRANAEGNLPLQDDEEKAKLLLGRATNPPGAAKKSLR